MGSFWDPDQDSGYDPDWDPFSLDDQSVWNFDWTGFNVFPPFWIGFRDFVRILWDFFPDVVGILRDFFSFLD